MKGMLFTPDNIRAIEENRKTVTRRLDGLKGINQEPDKWSWIGYDQTSHPDRFIFWRGFSGDDIRYIRPRYQDGIVYIKEAWATEKQYDHLKPSEIPRTAKICYVSDGVGEWPINLIIGKLRSPLFMMEWMAREFIKILDVRPERLQEITLEDCKAEGIHGYTFAKGCLSNNPPDPRWAYQDLWDSINPKYPWASNPWDFRYKFKRVDKEGK